MDCRNYNKVTQCEPQELNNQAARICEPFSICLPFGQRLVYDGECLRVEDGATIADGEYGVIVVRNNCIVDARPNPVFDYTPPPCAPNPSSCSETSDGITLQPTADNLLSIDASGRLGAVLVYEAGTGISITGAGTTRSPLQISLTETEAQTTHITSATLQALTVQGSGTLQDPYVLSVTDSGISPGNYLGLEIDRFGRVTGYEKMDEGQITSIIPGPGIDVKTQGGVASISLTTTTLGGGNYMLGGYEASIDMAGRIENLTSKINLEPVTFDPYLTAISVNQFGSITELQPLSRTPDVHFSSVFEPSRTSTVLSIVTQHAGQFRISYRGLLPSTATGSGGYYTLPSPFRILVDDQVVTAYALYDTARSGIVAIECLTRNVYTAGTHTVELSGTLVDSAPYSFPDFAFLDVTITG